MHGSLKDQRQIDAVIMDIYPPSIYIANGESRIFRCSRMARYYFNIHDRDGETKDIEGLDLPDLDAAHKMAIVGIRSLLSEEASSGRMDLRGRLEVTDATGEIALIIPFDEAIEIIPACRRRIW